MTEVVGVVKIEGVAEMIARIGTVARPKKIPIRSCWDSVTTRCWDSGSIQIY